MVKIIQLSHLLRCYHHNCVSGMRTNGTNKWVKLNATLSSVSQWAKHNNAANYVTIMNVYSSIFYKMGWWRCTLSICEIITSAWVTAWSRQRFHGQMNTFPPSMWSLFTLLSWSNVAQYIHSQMEHTHTHLQTHQSAELLMHVHFRPLNPLIFVPV